MLNKWFGINRSIFFWCNGSRYPTNGGYLALRLGSLQNSSSSKLKKLSFLLNVIKTYHAVSTTSQKWRPEKATSWKEIHFQHSPRFCNWLIRESWCLTRSLLNQNAAKLSGCTTRAWKRPATCEKTSAMPTLSFVVSTKAHLPVEGKKNKRRKYSDILIQSTVII